MGKANNSHPASIAKLIALSRAQNAKASLFPALFRANFIKWYKVDAYKICPDC